MLKPIITSIAITNRCNLKCIHCLPNSGLKNTNELSTCEIINIIEQAKSLGAMVIAFSGGEVFTREDFFEILEAVNKLNLRFSFTSNGTLINKTVAERLSAFRPLVARISLDSNVEEEHDNFRGVEGAYKKTVQGIRNLKQVGIPVTVITTITKKNMNRIEDIIALLLALQVDAFNTTAFVPFGRGELHSDLMLSSDEYKLVLLQLRELRKKYAKFIDIHWHDTLSFLLDDDSPQYTSRSCPAGWSMMEISADGFVMPCISMNIKEDNVRDLSLKNIWEDSQLFNRVRNVELTGKCQCCEYTNKCHGGCRAIAYNYYNDLSAPDPMCWLKDEVEICTHVL